MENFTFVEFTIQDFTTNAEHLIVYATVTAYYPLLKLDRDYRFTRAEIIDRLHAQEKFRVREGDHFESIRLVIVAGKDYIRTDSQEIPRDLVAD